MPSFVSMLGISLRQHMCACITKCSLFNGNDSYVAKAVVMFCKIFEMMVDLPGHFYRLTYEINDRVYAII